MDTSLLRERSSLPASLGSTTTIWRQTDPPKGTEERDQKKKILRSEDAATTRTFVSGDALLVRC